MKSPLASIVLAILGAGLLSSCSQHGLRTGMEYRGGRNGVPFSSTVYIFTEGGVFVYLEVGPGQIVCQAKDGSFMTSERLALRGLGSPAGTMLSKGPQDTNPFTVVFGPGDWLPVLASATYRVDGESVFVDWSKGQSEYFGVSGCGAGNEVFSVANGGLVLSSATNSGFALTLNPNGQPVSAADLLQREERRAYHVMQAHLRQNIEAAKADIERSKAEKAEIERRILAQRREQ